MILYINSSKDRELGVFLIKGKKVADKIALNGDFKVSDKLLGLIKQLLQKNKAKVNQVKGIICATGPGPFTSIRIAVAIANTLSYALKIPLVGIKNKSGKLDDARMIKLGLKNIGKVSSPSQSYGGQRKGGQLVPFYNLKPNITFSKK